MNDNDIVKALECCSQKSLKGNMCAKCPLFCEDCFGGELIKPLAFELIKRQKAEIERLKDMVAQNEGVLPRYERLIKAESIKEFADRLKQTQVDLDGIEMVAVGNIDAIMEQMTEE